MRDHLEAKPRGRHGEHRYAFAETGLDQAEERERFAHTSSTTAYPTSSGGAAGHLPSWDDRLVEGIHDLGGMQGFGGGGPGQSPSSITPGRGGA